MPSYSLLFTLAWTLAITCIASSTYADEAKPLRAMSFNIRVDFHYGEANDKPNAWNSKGGVHRRDLVMRTIADFDPDLLGVQEALAHQAEAISKTLPEFGSYGIGRDDGKLAGEQCAVYFRKSRFKLLDSGTFWLSETPDVPGGLCLDAACSRIASWVRLQDLPSDRPLLVINTHWDHVGEKARQFSAMLIRQRLSDLADGAGVIVMGDLNTPEDSPAIKTLLGGEQAVPKLIDSYRTIVPEQAVNEATFHGYKTPTKGRRIDYLFHTEGLKTNEAAIVRDPKTTRWPSDHYPVTAVLNWKTESN